MRIPCPRHPNTNLIAVYIQNYDKKRIKPQSLRNYAYCTKCKRLYKVKQEITIL